MRARDLEQCAVPRRESARNRFGRLAWWLLVAWFVLAPGGCGSRSTFEFDALDDVPGQEELTEVPLGEYAIPIPVAEYEAHRETSRRNRFQFDFKLFALVPAGDRRHVEAAWERHQGKIRDRVIRVCRNAALDDLQEPQLVSLKTELIQSIGPQLGEESIRQLMITEIVSQEI
jgi:hypothetical protein